MPFGQTSGFGTEIYFKLYHLCCNFLLIKYLWSDVVLFCEIFVGIHFLNDAFPGKETSNSLVTLMCDPVI